LIYCRTNERDRGSRDSQFLTFEVSCPCTVHVCFHDGGARRRSAPTWLKNGRFSAWGKVFCGGSMAGDVAFRIFSKKVPRGRVALGGNESADWQYFVLLSGPD
ncbi:unnamed protein product, partial [Phaeothamnion confervicola]